MNKYIQQRESRRLRQVRYVDLDKMKYLKIKKNSCISDLWAANDEIDMMRDSKQFRPYANPDNIDFCRIQSGLRSTITGLNRDKREWWSNQEELHKNKKPSIYTGDYKGDWVKDPRWL